ncbi:hypothetical protein KC19_VG198500 [Ceratodon purpureus]|uniref:Secreted protein n=1 Tax=Ceratodon purpureus TaxID=3225 RepID=A0A8T0HSE9_CERPU|nr:hypothetical protein KC19_VG198500 [Ceratodon purpureus]
MYWVWIWLILLWRHRIRAARLWQQGLCRECSGGGLGADEMCTSSCIVKPVVGLEKPNMITMIDALLKVSKLFGLYENVQFGRNND